MEKILVLNPFAAKIKFSYFLNWKFNGKKIFSLFLPLTFALLAFYVFQINNFTFQKYSVQNYQKSIEKLTQENEKLEANLAAMGSLSSIENSVSALNFEKISKIYYIQTAVGYVAVK